MKTFTQKINESVGYIEPTIKDLIINKLCNAYKEEISAWYYYSTVAEFLCGPSRKDIDEFYEDAAKDEFEDHAKWILKRIAQLGGCPSCVTPIANLTSATHQYVNPTVVDKTISVLSSLNNCKQMEMDAIETYRDLEEITRNVDPVTNRKVKAILADEEEHLQEIEDFLCDVGNSGSCDCGCCDCGDKCACDCEEPSCNDDCCDAISKTAADITSDIFGDVGDL